MTQHNALAARLRLRLTELTGEIETGEAQRRMPNSPNRPGNSPDRMHWEASKMQRYTKPTRFAPR